MDDENDPDLFWYKKYGSTKNNPNSKDPNDYPDITWAKKGSDADTNLTNITGGRFQYQKTFEDGNCGVHFFPAWNWWNALSQDSYGPEVATYTGCQHGFCGTRGFKKDGSPKGRNAFWIMPAAAAVPGTRHVLNDPHHAAALKKCLYICAVIVDGEMLHDLTCMPMHSSDPDKVFLLPPHKVLIFHMHEVPTLLMNAKAAPDHMVRLLTVQERVEHVRANQQRCQLKLTWGQKLVQSGKDQADYSS